MAGELFSFNALWGDQSVADWDMVTCVNEAAAAEHAMSLLTAEPSAGAVEVWSLTGFCFSVPAAPIAR